MIFRFLHTADWHIGKPFGRFPEERAGVLRRARLSAIDRLAAAARDSSAKVVLVAGDIYDGPGLADRDLLELMGRLATHRDLSWYLIPGNHDPATPGGIWDRLTRLGLPDNVHVCRDPKPIEIASGITLLPSPLAAKAVTADPTAWMATAATTEGAIRIGLAHGSTQGFGSDNQASVNIAPARARDAGLSYLALGDWHGTREVAPSTWYSGTPEPDSYQDNDPGNALLVTVSGPGAPALVERRRTAEMTWRSHHLTIRSPDDLATVVRELTSAGAAAASLLLDLTLEGEVALADDAAIREKIEREIDPRVFHLRTDLEHLSVAPHTDDLASLTDPILQQIAEELSAAAQTTGAGAAVAAHALRRLYQTARAEEARQ